jgi:hypothetical protein
MPITPGPWHWVKEDKSMIILGQVGNELEHHVLSCKICDACAERNAPCLSPSEDNANLIAASPELLIVLDDLIADFDDMGDVSKTNIHRAKEIIKKAKGIKKGIKK